MSVAINAYPSPQVGFTTKSMGGGKTATAASVNSNHDSAQISKLAQALTGKAADLFNQMDSKARGTLEALVNNGSLSAKDAVAGLAYLADSAEFQRYMEESPLTSAEAAQAAELEQLRVSLPSSGNAQYGAVREAVSQRKDALRAAFDAGQISEEELQRDWRAASMEMQKATEQHLASVQQPLQTYSDKLSLQIDSVLSRKMDEYQTAKAASSGDTTQAADTAGAKAAEKLEAAGFSLPLYRDALRAYAVQADVPGLGAKASKTTDTSTRAPAPTEPAATGMVNALAATPREQAGLDLLYKAAGQSAPTDGANAGSGFWAAKYLLSTMAKG